jgi:U3 small nucleolar RNA-associated protein 21
VFTGHQAKVFLLLVFGDHLISVAEDNSLKIWNMFTGELFSEINLGDNFTVSTIMHPDTYLNKILLGSK